MLAIPEPLEGERLNIQTARVFQPLLAPARYKGAYGGRGSGKCLAMGTLVVMADGNSRAVEDIAVGERLMGPDGRPRNVVGTTFGTSDLYEVQQKGGEPYIVT